PAGDDEGCADHRKERRCARERRVRVEDDRPDDDQSQTRADHHGRQRDREPTRPPHADRQGGSDCELPRTRRKQEERERSVAVGPDDPERERQQRDDPDDQPDPPDVRPPTCDEQEKSRPEQVELLLDAKGPEMEEWRGIELGLEVVGGLGCEADVADIQRCCGAISRDVRDTERWQHDRRRDDGQRDDDEGRRKQPAGTTCVEREEVDPPRRAELADDEAGDQETRHDIEDIDADVAARESGDPRVIREYQEYGDGPQAFDIGTERGASVSRGGRCHVRHGTRSCAPLPARGDGHTKTPEGTWSAVLSPDVNTVTATCDPSPFEQGLRYRDAVLLGTELSTSFVFRGPIPRYLSTTNPRSGRRRGGWIRRRWSDQAADKQMPEGTRSLDAPTEVNPSQITRCSCPFGQEERYETGGIGDKALIHDFHRRCVVS